MSEATETTLSPEAQADLARLTEQVARQMAQRQSRKSILKGLAKQGFDAQQAEAFVADVEAQIEQARNTPEVRKALAAKYKRHIWIGAIWAVGGTIVTVATFQAAREGGHYIVAWGAIVFGGLESLMGVHGWLKYS